MRSINMVLAALAVLAALPGAAFAQVELWAVLGYRGGDASFLVEADATGIECLLPPCVVAEARTPEGGAVGLVLDVPVTSGWMFEALLNRQEGSLRLAAGLSSAVGALAPESFEVTTLQVGALRHWARDGLRPFLAGGIGLARAETSARILIPPVRPGTAGRRFDTAEALSLSFGGGARLRLDSRWGLRFEARAYWTDLPAELGGGLVQVEVGVGLGARP